jgi:hypothetical protein
MENLVDAALVSHQVLQLVGSCNKLRINDRQLFIAVLSNKIFLVLAKFDFLLYV